MNLSSILSAIKDTVSERFSWRSAVALVLLTIVIVWVLFTVSHRIQDEARNKTVEFCLDWDEVNALCAENGYPVADFLDRCRAIGAFSVSLNEETLSTLTAGGGVIYFSNADYGRLRILDLLAPGTAVTANSLLIQDPAAAAYLSQQLKVRYGVQATSRKAGKYQVLSSPPLQPLERPLWTDNLPLGYSQARIDFLAEHGFSVVLRPQNSGNPAWFGDALPKNFSGFLWDGREVPGYPGNEHIIAKKIRDSGTKFVALEFYSTYGADKMNRLLPGSVVRGHTISASELNTNPSSAFWLQRWSRAVHERNIRFLYVHFFQQKTIEDNITYLRLLAQGLKKDGFMPGKAVPPGFPLRGLTPLWTFLALAGVVFVPLIALSGGKKIASPPGAYCATNAVTLLGGLLAAALLYDTVFMQKVVEMPAVKLSMLLPLALSVFIVFPPQQLKKIWNAQVHVRHVVIAGVFLAALGVLLIRTGNHPAFWFGPENSMRQFLENALAVRPRTKEFLFAQPLLLLGFQYRKPVLLWLGILGQISIMNTFLHGHTPVLVSLVRTLHGMWLGLLIGYGIVLLISWLKKRMPFAHGSTR